MDTSIFDEMDKMFSPMFPVNPGKQITGFMPAVNISQTDNDVSVEVSLPGIDPEKVNVSIENDVLTIDGSTQRETEVEEKNYYRKEMISGGFHRSVALPTAVDGDKASAEYKDGILIVTIPKKDEVKPKTVKVKVTK